MNSPHPSIHEPASWALVRKIFRHLLPFCILCHFFNYLDRLNVSIANTPMQDKLGRDNFNDHIYAIGVAVFFIGYCTFEVPSNLLQQKFGARRWIARIMISWGIVSTCFLFVQGPKSFYVLRLLLGFAEAGFFPGMILYLSYWIPQHHRARAAAIFLTSTAVAGIVGNLVSGSILYYTANLPYLHSWQYLFLFEGVPTIIIGLCVLAFLPDQPKDAKWLNDQERRHLQSLLGQDRDIHPAPHLADFKHAFSTPQVWLLALLYSLHSFGFYAINFWTPRLIEETLKSTGSVTDQTPLPIKYLHIAMLSSIPFGAAAVGMVLIGRSSDKHNERRYHLAFSMFLAAVGLALAALAPSMAPNNIATFITIAGLSIAAIGEFGSFGPFWSLPNSLLTGTAAATAIALINSIGNFMGGFVGPPTIKHLDFKYGFLLAAGLSVASTLLILVMPLRLQRSAQP
jgi:MFS family permease